MGYDYKARKKSSQEQNNYTDRRIDLLLIAFAGAALYVVLEVLKYSKEHADLKINTDIPKIVGGIMVLTVLINFLSLMTSKRSYRNDIMMCDEGLSGSDDDKFNRHHWRVGFWDGFTVFLNIASYLTLIAGLGILCYYFFMIF